MATPAQQAAADKARAAAIAAIKKDVPGIANPENYVTSANKPNIAEARKAFISTNLGLDPALFKSGSSYNIALANKAGAIKGLGLDYTKFAKSGYDIAQANEAIRFKNLGVTNVESLVDSKTGKFSTPAGEERLIRDVYKLDPATFLESGKKQVGTRINPQTRKQEPVYQTYAKYNIDLAAQRFEAEKPKVTTPDEYPQSFTQAVNNYSEIFQRASDIGIQNLNKADRDALNKAGMRVRDFAGKNISPAQQAIIDRINDVDESIRNYSSNITLATERAKAIPGTPEFNALSAQEKKVAQASWNKLTGKEREAARNNLSVAREGITRSISEAAGLAPRFQESFTRFGLSDILPTTGAPRAAQVTSGLEALRGDRMFQTGALAGRLGSQVTDEQILSDINTARRNEYKSLYDIGTAAVTDLQSQIQTAQGFLADLPANDPRRASTQATLDSLQKELTQAQADTLQARNLYENYTPIAGTQASTALANFRESLRLPEQRTLDQIKEIDPNLFNTITQLTRQYGELAATPIGPTTAESTEALRRQTEEQIAGQLALGSQLGAEERRQYEQAARAAQTARGNVFGVAPAVEEAVTTGLAGEQRLAARLGAAQGFLSSGQSVSDALARDVSLRNALQQSRLGAAAEFVAAGPTPYNLAAQRAQQQQAGIAGLMAAAQPPATGGFQATPSAMVPYAYTDPMAGFRGAQNAANIYGSLSDYAARTYGAQVGAIAQSYTSPSQAFGNIASGLSRFMPNISFTP